MFALFPLFARGLGASDATIGLVLGVGEAASVATRPLVGVLLDRVGRRRVLVWGALLNALSLLPFLGLTGVGPGLYLWTMVHFLVWGALGSAYFTYAADLAPPERRAEGIAIFGMAGLLPVGFGPALGEVVIGRGGFPAFFLVAAGFALVSLALSLLVPPGRPVPHPTETRHVPGGVGHAIRRGGLARVLVATAIFGVAANAASFFVAPFTRDVGVARAGPFFVAYALSGSALRVFGRRALDRIGAHRIVVPGFAIYTVGLALLCLLPARGTLVLAGVACGAAHGSLFPMLNTLTIARMPPHLVGTAVSLFTGSLDLGAVVGTPICGAIANARGFRVMFALVAVATIVGLVLVATDPRRQRRRRGG